MIEDQVISLQGFYQLGKEFVAYYPAQNQPCDRPQTFAVLSSYSHLNSDNLSKVMSDAFKPYFFSRPFAKANYSPSKLTVRYPAVIMLEKVGVITNPFSCKATTICNTLEVAFLHRYYQDCHEGKKFYGTGKDKKGCDDCAQRSIDDLFGDSERMMVSWLQYLKDVVYIEAGENSRYINKYLAPQIQHSDGQTPTKIDTLKTRKFQKLLERQNTEMKFSTWEGSVHDLYGKYTEINFCFEFCKDDFQPEYIEDYKVGVDGGCC